MSMFADYVREVSNKKVHEDSDGFAVYSFCEADRFLYIEDFYIVPASRNGGCGRTMLGMLTIEGRDRGCTHLVCSIDPEAKQSVDSLKAILSVGFTPLKTEGNRLFLIRAIGSKQ